MWGTEYLYYGIHRAAPDLMGRLPGRSKFNHLEPRQLLKLVEDVDAGFKCPATLYQTGGRWRLRLTINNPFGGSVRRGFTVPDDETARRVRAHLEDARERWQAARRKMQSERMKREVMRQLRRDGKGWSF